MQASQRLRSGGPWIVLVLATAGAYFEFNRNGDAIAVSGNEFAIADSAIQDEVAQ